MNAARLIADLDLLAILAFAGIGIWTVTGWAVDPIFDYRRRRIESRIEELKCQALRDQIRGEILEEYGDPEDYDDGRSLTEETRVECAQRLRRALEAMKRGDLKDARYEIEDAHEELAA